MKGIIRESLETAVPGLSSFERLIWTQVGKPCSVSRYGAITLYRTSRGGCDNHCRYYLDQGNAEKGRGAGQPRRGRREVGAVRIRRIARLHLDRVEIVGFIDSGDGNPARGLRQADWFYRARYFAG